MPRPRARPTPQEAARATLEELAGKAAAQELRFKNEATL